MKLQRTYNLLIELEDGEAIVIEPPITIAFSIQRHNLASANTMSLQVYNLGVETRNRIFQDRYNPKQYKKIILQGGYSGMNGFLATMFVGNIFEAYSERSGSDIITNITSRDGGFDIANSLANFTLSAGTSNRDVVTTLIDQFLKISAGAIGEIPGQKKRGVVCLGNTIELIKRETGNKFFIDLEKINVLKDNEVIIGDVPLINSDTGLLGTPQRQDSYLTIDMVFEPRITIGQVIEVQSDIQKQFNGQFKVIGASHAGIISESVGGECRTTLNLLIGTQLFGSDNIGVGNFNIIGNTGSSIDEVYNFLVENGKPPETQITTSFKWSDMLKNYSRQGETPSKVILANLVKTANRLQQIKNQFFRSNNITVTSGWRSRSYNATIPKAATNSFHISGLAVDFVVAGISSRTVQNLLSNYNGGLGYNNEYNHIDLGARRRFGFD